MADTPSETIGKYRVIRNLASGSQGTVYHAHDPELDREVAVKVLHPHLANPDVIARFQREAQIIASISHPNIAGITDIGERERSHFIAIEYVPHSIRELIDRGPLDVTRAVTIAHQAALALEAARTSRRGITHHDIKPDNLLLTSLGPEGVVKLIDFGIAHAADMAPMTQAGSQLGTPYYMPPEQWMGERGDTRSDVYSLGVVLYQMLIGQVPFSSTASNSLAQQNEIARQHIEVDAATLRSLRGDIPEALEAIVVRCMAKSPGDRYQTPGEMAEALAGVIGLATGPSASLPASHPPIEASGASQPGTPPSPDGGDASPPISRLPMEEGGDQRPPRGSRTLLFAIGGFGGMIVIAMIVILASQSGGNNGPPTPVPLLVPPATRTPTPTPTPIPPSSTPTPTNTPAPTLTPTPTNTQKPTPVPPTLTPAPTITPTPTLTPTITPTPTPTITPTPTLTPSPTSTGTPTPTPSPTPVPEFISFFSIRDVGTDIYTMNSDGTWEMRLTESQTLDKNDWDPSWSPDGRRIVYSSFRDGNWEIYLMNADGSGATRLTEFSSVDRHPNWSPDGRRVVFSSDRDGNNEIYVMNADGTGVTRLTESASAEGHPNWSPNGRRIAFSSGGDDDIHIYVMNTDGSNVTQLTDGPALDRAPNWSPDGRRIVFFSDRDGNNEIYVMNANGTGIVRLTDSRGQNKEPSWSPDGQRIVFVSSRDGNDEIYLMNADGMGVTRLTDNTWDDGHPSWSLKGR